MIAPAALFLASLAGIVAAFVLPGWRDLLLIAGPSAAASLYLFLRAPRPAKSKRQNAPRNRDDAPRTQIILDGSNVMHWQNEVPSLHTLREVLARLIDEGFEPGVVFDANAGYRLFGTYLHDDAFSKALELPRDRVMVVPKGTPADPIILTAARDLGARIVTNDRYRDWVQDFPELAEPGQLVPGGYRDGKLWLGLGNSTLGAGQEHARR